MKIDSTNTLLQYQSSKTSTINKNQKDDEALKAQTDAFESILLEFMLDTSLNLDDPLYPKQAGAEIYQSMYKDTLSQQLSGNFGYSQMLFEWLKQQQKG